MGRNLKPSRMTEGEQLFWRFVKVLKKLNLANGEKDLAFGTQWVRNKVRGHWSKL